MILITLLMVLKITPSHSFVPSVFNYERYEMSLDNTEEQACTLDLEQCTSFIGNYLRLYQRGPTSYSMVTQVDVVCDPGMVCSIDQNYLKKDGSMAIVYSLTDKKFKIYSIMNNTFNFVQSIQMVNPLYKIEPLRGNHLVLGNLSTLYIYKYDTSSNQYVQAFPSFAYITAQSLAYAFSSDGKMIVQIYQLSAADNDFSMTIFQLNIGTGLYSITISPMGFFPAGTNKIIKQVRMIERGGVYVLLGIFQDGGTYYLKYYHINIGFTLTTLIQQQLVVAQGFLGGMYITQNGRFLCIQHFSFLQYFQYDSMIDQYVSIYNLTAWRANPFRFHVAQNGTRILVLQYHLISLNSFVLLFTCELQYCYSCSFIGVCATCLHGYTLNKNVCGCGVNQSLTGGACISCAISNCASCSSVDVCSGCSNGFQLSGKNTCQCPNGSIISVTGDSCDKNQENVGSLWIVVIVLLVVVGLLVVVLAAVIVRIVTIRNTLQKVKNEPTLTEEDVNNANNKNTMVTQFSSVELYADLEGHNKAKNNSKADGTVKRRKKRRQHIINDLGMEL